MTSKKVAVVILNWNGATMMHRFLPSVIANSPEAEVIVADNGSTDESLEMLQEEFPSVRIIVLDRNYGFAEGYNKALAEIEEIYTVLLNSDVKVTNGWLIPLIDYMEENPKVAVCQPKILNEAQHNMFEYAGASGGFMDILCYPFCRGRIFDTIEKDEGQYNTPISIFWASGAAMFVRTDIFRKVGGLDARFFAHQEEIDFCWRLHSRGYSIVCLPQSKVYHVGGGTLNKDNPRKTYLNFRNNLLMIHKNMQSSDMFWVMLVRYFLDYIAMVQMFFTGRRGDAMAIIRARFDFRHICHEFDHIRRTNLAATVCPRIPEMMRKSLLWKYYICGKKKFSDLK